jgi:transposase
MPATFQIRVTETPEELKAYYQRTPLYLRVRIKMLRLIGSDITQVGTLCAKLGISAPTLQSWKAKYSQGGIDTLLNEGRGGDKRSGITAEQKQKIAEKLSAPQDAFRTYGEAQAWLKEELGIEKEYHALNKYLKRNWGTKLKVGRKSHVKKDEAAVAVFKKPPRSA